MDTNTIILDNDKVSVYLTKNGSIKISVTGCEDKFWLIKNIDGKLVIEKEVEK